jgi:hypothetical protein
MIIGHCTELHPSVFNNLPEELKREDRVAGDGF